MLSVGLQKTIANPLQYELRQGVPGIKVVAATPLNEPKPAEIRIVYELLLNVQLKGQPENYWLDGNN